MSKLTTRTICEFLFLFAIANFEITNLLFLCLPEALLGPEGKFIVAKFEFGGSFGMSLEGDCHEVEVTPNLEVLVTFGRSFEGVCHELCT
jgi:hypothetical protein